MDEDQQKSTLSFVKNMCKEPKQQEVIQWMESAPKEQVMSFLKGAVRDIPRDHIPYMVNEQLPNATPDEKQTLYNEIIQVYDFLSQNQ